MALITLDVNRAEWTRRAEMLARTATDAEALVYGRDLTRLGICGIERHHSDSLGGAMALAVAAILIVRNNDTILLHPYGVTDLNR